MRQVDFSKMESLTDALQKNQYKLSDTGGNYELGRAYMNTTVIND